MRIRTFLTSLICIAALSVSASAAIRPEVGNPLHEALKLAEAHNYKAAMARLNTADKVANKSDEETRIISDIRAYLDFLTGGPGAPCRGQECDF